MLRSIGLYGVKFNFFFMESLMGVNVVASVISFVELTPLMEGWSCVSIGRCDRHDSDTSDNTELCYFLKLLLLSKCLVGASQVIS